MSYYCKNCGKECSAEDNICPHCKTKFVKRFDFTQLEGPKHRKRLIKWFKFCSKKGRNIRAIMFLLVVLLFMFLIVSTVYEEYKYLATTSIPVILVVELILSVIFNKFFSDWLLTQSDEFIFGNDEKIK